MCVNSLILSNSEYYKNIGDHILSQIRAVDRGILVFGGGNSPSKVNEYLRSEFEKDLSLDEHFENNFTVFLSDERYVSRNNPLSNYAALKNGLFFNKENLKGMNVDLSIDDCIKDYSNTIQKELDDKKIIFSLLGVGSDGHTASLFPGQFKESNDLVQYGGLGSEGLQRITLSHKLLLSSKGIGFIVNSKGKLFAMNKSKNQSSFLDFPLIPFFKPKSIFYILEDIL